MANFFKDFKVKIAVILLIAILTIIASIKSLINRNNFSNKQTDFKNSYQLSNSNSTSIISPTENIDIIDKVIVTEPYLGTRYECREDKLALINESFSSYNIAVNNKNTCTNNIEVTKTNCANRCNRIWDICSSATLWEPIGYKSKNECVDGESPKYNSCREGCRNDMTEEFKRCNSIESRVKELMNNLLKKYCEISLE
jgi:hypothetical protein